MKILILTVGTRGDVQPYVALGKGLLEAGHHVTIGTCVHFESFVREHGLDYAFVNNDLLDLMHSPEGRLAMERMHNIFEVIRVAWKLIPRTKAMARRQVDELWESTAKVNPDLILFHPKAQGARDFAEKLGVPCMLAFYLPMYIPTGDVPTLLFPNLKLGRWYRRFTHRFVEQATWWGTRAPINRWRVRHYLPKRTNSRFLQTAAGNRIPVVYAYSEHVVPRPSDWPDWAQITGYWFLDRQQDWQPPSELEAFLANGEAPIYIGFGSIFGLDPRKQTRIILEAVRQSGTRAIIARGWGGVDAGGAALPDGVMEIKSAPHDWLFPRVSAVVHHGGCGTTSAGLRAGKPTLICPFFGDQPYWGSRVHELGLGPKPILQKNLNVENLAEALREISGSEEIRKRANVIGEKIRSENGVQRAVELVEELFGNRAGHPTTSG